MQIVEEHGHTAVVEALRALIVEQLQDKQPAVPKKAEQTEKDPIDLQELLRAARHGKCSRLGKLLEKPRRQDCPDDGAGAGRERQPRTGN